MRVLVKLVCDRQGIVLPIGFASCLQGFIYSNLPEKKADWLHDEGFVYEKRAFKLFVFSSLLERGCFNRSKRLFYFPAAVSFYLSSPVDWILTEFARTITSRDSLKLGSNPVAVSSVEILPSPGLGDSPLTIQALTGIEVHSTIMQGEKKKTRYYTPFEREFSQLISHNLQKKWTALTRQACPHTCQITPLFTDHSYEKITYFDRGPRRIVIKGWLGKYKLAAHPDLLNFAYHTGLGSKNSQGYGLWQVLK